MEQITNSNNMEQLTNMEQTTNMEQLTNMEELNFLSKYTNLDPFQLEAFKIIDEYKFGEIVTNRNPKLLAKQIKNFNREKHSVEIINAKKILNWENEDALWMTFDELMNVEKDKLHFGMVTILEDKKSLSILQKVSSDIKVDSFPNDFSI